VAGRAGRVRSSRRSGAGTTSGGDGVTLDSLEVRIHARAPVRVWGKFIKETKLAPIPSAGKGKGEPRYAAFFYALPTDRDGSLYVYGDLRSDPENSEKGHFKLRWELKPDGPMPQRIMRSHRAVEGWPTVAQRIATFWPGGERVSVDVTATFVMDGAVHALRPALRLKPGPSKVGQHHLLQTASAWRVEPPSGPVHRVSIAPVRENEVVIVASGHHTLTLGPDIGAELEHAVRAGVETFLGAP